MSKATKRKHVTREVLEDYVLPDDGQLILKILGGRGNNLHEAQTSHGDRFLISMPTRFRKNVWIKRGDFVLADPITEGDKVKAEIVAILYPKQIKYIKEEKLWPEGFDVAASNSTITQESDNRIEEITSGLKDATLSDEQQESNHANHHLNDRHEEDEDDYYSSEDNDDDLFVNTNRPTVTYFYSDSSDDSNDDDNDDEDEDEDEEEEGEGDEAPKLVESVEERYSNGSDCDQNAER